MGWMWGVTENEVKVQEGFQQGPCTLSTQFPHCLCRCLLGLLASQDDNEEGPRRQKGSKAVKFVR